MNITNEHIIIGILAAYILYKYYYEKDIESKSDEPSEYFEENEEDNVHEHLSPVNIIPNNYSYLNIPTMNNMSNYSLPNQIHQTNQTNQTNNDLNIPKYSKHLLHSNVHGNLPKPSNTLKNIPKMQKNLLKTQPQLNSSCKMPDRQTAKCVADMLMKTGCVKCSLESCDTNHTISASCYENEKHSCSGPSDGKSKGYQVFESMHDSMHDNQFNGMHTSLNESIYNPMKISETYNSYSIPKTSNISGNDVQDGYSTCNLEESNSLKNLNQENALGILRKGYSDDYHYGSFNGYNNLNSQQYKIEDYNNRPVNKHAEMTIPRGIGLQRSLDGSFFKYSRLG